MDAIEALLKQKIRFHCVSRSGGSGEKTIDVVHSTTNLPDDYDFQEWVPPSMRSVLGTYGLLRLFQPADGVDDGIRLFSVDECLHQLALFRRTIKDARELVGHDEEYDSESYEAWIAGLCPVAEIMQSGDLFAIDTENERDDRECRVVFLDHEEYFGGFIDPDEIEVVAQDFAGFLKVVLTDPLKYISPCWNGGDIYDQWFAKSISRLD